MSTEIILIFIVTLESVWCSPFPQNGTAQVSLTGSPPSGVLMQGNSAPVGVTGSGSSNVAPRPQRLQLGVGDQYQGSSANFPVPFHGNVLSSGLGLGSSALQANTQSASMIMDGVSYGLSRVPSYVGYGVQSAGRLERAGEQLFKAVLDLGTGSATNGMQGLSLGMNVMNGLGTAGMQGLSKVATGSSQILQHILSLGATESGLFNTLVALSRLMSPAQGSFLSSGLNLTSLMNAANYLGIPSSNANLSTILNAASSLQSALGNAGKSISPYLNAASNAASGVNVTAIRESANAAVQNLGLSTAWNILSSRLSAGSAPRLQAAVSSNDQLPVSGAANGIVQRPESAAPQADASRAGSGGNSWMGWLG